MDKNKIKTHLQSFLGEAEKVPNGLSITKPVQDKEAKVNKAYYKDVTKKMEKYEKDTTTDADSISAGDIEKTSSEEKDVNFNGMDQIQYDNDPGKKFKERAIEALEGSSKMGNETYEGKWNPETGSGNGNTEEVWGASGGKHTGKEIVKNALKNSKKDARPQEDAVGYVPQKATKTKLAVENKENNNEIIKENNMEKKIKRATFKQPFNGIGKALAIIPEGYKVDGNVFEMTDGNENYRMRWEGTLEEGQAITLMASDKQMMNEDIQKMKHLMGFKAESTLGTPTSKERVHEESSFRDMMNLTSKILSEGVSEDGDRKPINESAFAGMGFTSESNLEEVAPAVTEEEVTEEEVTESKGITPDVAADGDNTKIGASADGIVRGAGHDKHVMEDADVTEGEEITEEDVTEEVVEESFNFEPPTIYKLVEGADTQSMGAGTDLGTDIGKTASGDPRGEGHDKHIMEEDEDSEVEVEMGGVEVEVSKEDEKEEK